MAAFPSYPVLLVDGYRVKRGSAVKRTEFEDGFAKQYKRFSRVLIERPVLYRLKSKADYASFLTWFNDTINRGADWFDWVDPLTGSTLTMRIKGGVLEEEIPAEPTLNKWDIKFILECWDA